MKNNLFLPRRIEDREKDLINNLSIKYNKDFNTLPLNEFDLFLKKLVENFSNTIIEWSNKSKELLKEFNEENVTISEECKEHILEALVPTLEIQSDHALLKKLYKKRNILLYLKKFKKIFLWE